MGHHLVQELQELRSHSSAAMKFSLVATLVVVLAVAHGTQAGALVKRDIQSEVNRITKIIKDMSASITTATQDMVEKVKALEVTNTAQTYVMEKFFQQVMNQTKALLPPQ